MDNSSRKVENVTSFRKKKAQVPQIPGTKVSFHNAQLLTSTGVSSLDVFLGGGLAVGTVLLIEEDCFRMYSSLLLKYFIAEGVSNGHSIFLASGDTLPEKILQEIPAAVLVEKTFQSQASDEQLKIAWRYRNQNASQVTSSSCSTQQYDLSKSMNKEDLDKCHIRKWNPTNHASDTSSSSWHSFVDEPYSSLLHEIQREIERGNFNTSSNVSERSILRLAIGSIHSPLWYHGDQKSNESTLPRFFYGLRMLLRSSFAVAVITVPKIMCENLKWFSRVKQMVDSVVSLEPLMKAAKNSNLMFKDFDGLLHVIKLPVLNGCAYQIPPSDLAFKLKRKNFIVEKLHLPPDLSGPDTSQGNSGSFSCCSGQKASVLDF